MTLLDSTPKTAARQGASAAGPLGCRAVFHVGTRRVIPRIAHEQLTPSRDWDWPCQALCGMLPEIKLQGGCYDEADDAPPTSGVLQATLAG